MKKIILLLILTIFLSGCSVFNLDDFVLPDDIEFLKIIENLNTPEKICNYMEENFEYEFHPLKTLTPYNLFLHRKGDCDDFATFAIYISNYHGYETYQIKIYFSGTLIRHYLGVFVENGIYTFSSNRDYYPWLNDTFTDVVECYTNKYIFFKVYDYNMNLIEQNYASW